MTIDSIDLGVAPSYKCSETDNYLIYRLKLVKTQDWNNIILPMRPF